MKAGLHVSESEFRELLVERLEVITSDEFEAARSVAGRFQVPLERALAERGHIPPKFLLEQLAQQWGVKFCDLKISDINPEALRRVREEYARTHLLVPFDLTGDTLSVAMADPRDSKTIAQLQHLTSLRIAPYLAAQDRILRGHLLYRGNLLEILQRAAEEQGAVAKTGHADAATTATVLLERILEYAAVTDASDIHIEPYEHETLVRYRIDGVLREVLRMPPQTITPLAVRIKALASMRVDDRRAPQDGRFDGDLGAFKLDLRISTLPTHWGEKIVVRVLLTDQTAMDLEGLGLMGEDYDVVLRNILRPYGMVLVTGPTGAGKSTTLYAVLAHLGSEKQNLVNISTIEDPVEHPLPRISQVSINSRAGIDFASGLRAVLRQDPDIIMVGEIRDRDTADIAVRAALVGRLLFSTLHTNDATTAIPRLIDMGVEPFLLASTLTMVVAQRLVRRICMNCRESIEIRPELVETLSKRTDYSAAIGALRAQGMLGAASDDLKGIRLFRGKGCRQCGGSGYRGRVGLFEILEIDEETRRMMLDRRDAPAIRGAAINRGMKTMFQDGLAKMLLGQTTAEELMRATM